MPLPRVLTQPRLPAALLLAATLVWFATRSLHGYHFMPFGDESGHLLGARAIRSGDRLYRDFIDAHGPLSFIVAHLYGMLFGWREPLYARRAVTAIILAATAIIAASSCLRGAALRLWAASLFLGLIAAPWLVQSLNMLNYHVLGGALVAVVLAWLAVPAWVGTAIPRWQAYGAGLCLAWLCADAYALAPSAMLLAGGSACALAGGPDRERTKAVLAPAALGFLTGGGLVLIWMSLFGDLLGYLVFHIIDNQVNYARYSSFGWGITFRSLVPSAAPGKVVQTGAAFVFEAGCILLGLQRPAGRPRRKLLRWAGLLQMVAALLMLNFRGAFAFQDGSFVVAAAALFALALPMSLSNMRLSAGRAWAITVGLGLVMSGFELADRTATLSPFGDTRSVFVHWPRFSLKAMTALPIVRRIHQVLHPGERLLVLEYDPSFFLFADVLPVRKFHEYLPWEADYARNPWFGLQRDLCAELRQRPPPAIVYTPWKVWGAYAPETFMPCLADVLKTGYVADAIPTLYVRRDRQP